MEFSRKEYWSGWPFPSPGDLPDPGIESRSPALVKVKVAQSCPTLCDPTGCSRQVPLSMGFSGPEYWSG